MQLIKINEQIVSKDVIDESKYRDAFCGRDGANRRFKCFVIRKADAKNPAPSKRLKDNEGNEFPDHIELDFDSAFNFAKDATAPAGHLFNKKKGSTIAYLRFSTQEGNNGDENTGKTFDKCDPKFTLLFVDGKLSSQSKKVLDTLYVDTKNGNYVVDNSPKVNDEEAEKERISKQVLQMQNSEIEKVSTELKASCGEDTWSIIPKEIKNYFCICDDVITDSEGKKLPKNGIIVEFERNAETGNIDYKKLSYFADGKEINSTDLSEKQIKGSKQAIETLSAFYNNWENKNTANKAKADKEQKEKSAEAEQNPEQDQETSEDQANAEEQPQENNAETQQQNQQQNPQETQPFPANVQNDLTSQDKKKPISYVNAKNGVLNVKKGDYAIGSDGKLRLIKKNDANYATTAHGKAVRNLHIDRNLRDVLRNLELMESKKINEADEDKRLENIKNNDTIQNLEATFKDIETNLGSFTQDEAVKAFFENDEKNKPLFANINGKKFQDAKATILNLKQRIEDITNEEIWQADQNKKEFDIIRKIDIAISNLSNTLIEAQNDVKELSNLKDNTAISTNAVKDIESFNSHIEDTKEAAENAIQSLEQIEDTTLRGAADADTKKEKDQADKDKDLKDGRNAVIDYDSAPKNIKDILDSDSFKKEVEAYGATKTNPFIAFLLNVKKRPAIWTRLSVGIYGVIHDAVVHGNIGLTYLMAENDPKLKCPNMLLCQDFYKLSVPEIEEYFEIRRKLASRIGYTINPLTPNEEIKMSNGKKFNLPKAGIVLTAETASQVLFVHGKEELNPIKDVEIITNNLFSGEEKERKKLSTDQEGIIKSLARQIQCKEDELVTKKDALLLGMKVLLNRAFNNIPLDIAKVKEYAKKVGIDENNLFKGIEQDMTKGGWRDFFDADNIDNEKTVNSYITAVANILNSSGAKQ